MAVLLKSVQPFLVLEAWNQEFHLVVEAVEGKLELKAKVEEAWKKEFHLDEEAARSMP